MKALIVEDDRQTIEAISLIFQLRWPDARILSTNNGSEAAPIVKKESPDVVILDLILPDIDGTEVLKELRAFSNVPVVIVTVRDDSTSQITGLELGANDYITKPFDSGVLLSRVKKAIEKNRTLFNQVAAPPFTAGNLTIDFANRQVSFQGKPVKLTPIQYNLLCYLAENAGRTSSYENILKAVWGRGHKSTDVLKTCVYQLRHKLIEAGASPEIIISERGIGYKFAQP